MPLYFTIAGQSSKRYQAVLGQIEPAPDSIARDRSLSGQTGAAPADKATAVYYKGLFSIPNPDGALRTYMSTEVHIVLAQSRTALLVPVSALRSATQANRAIVRVMLKDQQTEEREIETGITDKVNVEVLSGLTAGETILLDADANANADKDAQGDEDV
jgi:macrolide-specific efflux system membrane fusion protein